MRKPMHQAAHQPAPRIAHRADHPGAPGADGLHRQALDGEPRGGSDLERTLKCWNRLHGTRLRSWQLEVMIGSMFAAWSADPRLDITHFFAQAPNWIEVPDPGGGLLLSAGMSDADIEATRMLLCDAHIRAAQAVEAEARADRAGALAMWRQLFGEAFLQRA
jgi:hypothetical protein